MQLDPVVLEHAAAFVDRSPWEVSRDASLLALAHAAAHRVYGHQPVIAGMDVYNVEAEAWGVPVERPPGNEVPVLHGPLFSDPTELLSLPPLAMKKDGRLPVLLGAARLLARELPRAEVRIALAGPFSIALGLLGLETLLMELLDAPEAVAKALHFLGEHQAQLCREAAEEGFSVTLYESGAAPPLVPRELFSELIAPALGHILRTGKAIGAPVACIVGGDMAPLIGQLLPFGPCEVICPSETDRRAFMEKAACFPETAVRMNLPAALIAGNDETAIHAEIERAATFARLHPRARLGTGVLSYDANPQKITALCRFAEALG